ncbi:hypothetical protein ACJMK2_040053 [Sinanodonta woodiana]|uniref:Major facilitator superfamily (MFS) profile domain-containing protein n=1 Tax=Sinanodonta woodiana TaxID=1069815 RepID=A0ABD3WDT8_SINWO
MDSKERTPLLKKEDMEPFWRKVSCYSIYALVVFLVTYLLNQLDRYMLAITSKSMAQEIHFGDQACMTNSSFTDDELKGANCNATVIASCRNITNKAGNFVCEWNYNGQGLEYQIVAGPVFILIYTFAGIFIGFLADRYNRKILLASCLIFWSAMTLLTGFVKEYWQLVILRFGLGFGEAGCTPFVASMIGDIFPAELRGTTLGIYNWGIYMGYSMSYAIGNFITVANINGQGWRWTFIISGIPGIVLGLLIFFTIKEPERKTADGSTDNKIYANLQQIDKAKRRWDTLKAFIQPSLLLACLAGSVRNAAGYVFAYNTQLYFNDIGQTKEDIGKFMSWIPIVGGSLGVLFGGFISDRVVKSRGVYARVAVIIASLVLAAPFAAGTLYFNPPYAYICQIPSYLFGEMWISITLALVIELVPSHIRTSTIAAYLFIISNIGGNMPLLVPPINDAFIKAGYAKAEALRAALYILYPGLYILGALMFVPSMFVLKRDQARAKKNDYYQMNESTESVKM